MFSKTNNTGTGSTLLLHEIIQQKLHKIGNHINLMMNRVLLLLQLHNKVKAKRGAVAINLNSFWHQTKLRDEF